MLLFQLTNGWLSLKRAVSKAVSTCFLWIKSLKHSFSVTKPEPTSKAKSTKSRVSQTLSVGKALRRKPQQRSKSKASTRD